MPGSFHAPALAEVLSSRRRSRFVGRAAEIELVTACLEADSLPFSLIFVHGPGGIGKTGLLQVFGALAEQRGVRVSVVDGGTVLANSESVATAIGSVWASESRSDGTDLKAERSLLLIDSYEHLVSVDDWVRTELVTRLPADTLVVIAGRTPPSPSWRSDPAWQELLRVVALRNLAPGEAREFLLRSAVPDALHQQVLERSYGHPFGLSLLTDLALRVGDVDVDQSPDLVTSLVERFLDAVPDRLERQALLACALARVTTEPLLRAALDVEDSHDMFDWLHRLSFVEAGPEGLSPHDLARDVIDCHLRWRDPEGYRVVFRRIRSHIHDQVASLRGEAQQRGIFDEKFVFRNLPSILSPVDWATWGSSLPRPAGAADREAVLDLIGRHEGSDSVEIAEHWFDRQPDAFLVMRKNAAVTGVIGLLDLTAAAEEDRAADPGAQAAWEQVAARGGIHDGQRVTQTRFVVDSEAYQAPSATLNAVPIVTMQRYLAMPELACDFLTLHDPDPWNDYFALADLPRMTGADFEVGGHRYGLFGHDFRAVPIGAMMELWTERALAEDPTVPAPSTPTPLMLSQQDFADAVRQALRDLHRPDLLARNPLQRTRFVMGLTAHGRTEPERLVELLQAAIATLVADPRNDKCYQAVHQTYLCRTNTQNAAAARLGMPFSTYRRHLTRGVEQVVSWCWQREIYGPSERVGSGPD